MSSEVKDEVVEDTSMADDIRAAMEDLEKGGEKPTEVKVEKDRDETGKFTKKEEVKEPESEKKPEEKVHTPPKEPISEKLPEQKDPEESKEPLLTQDKAPIGWGVKARERWEEIPKELREEIVRREDASAQGVRQLHEQFAPARQFVESLGPFIKEAIDGNQHPAEYIGRVMHAERRLRVGSDQERFGALVEIAEGYGIPLRQIINEAVGREVVSLPQKQQLPADVQRELEEARQLKAQMAQQQAQEPAEHPEITAFRNNPENKYFEDVRGIMADIMELPQNRGMTLEQAYKEALWHHPEIRTIILDKQNSKESLNSKQKDALGVKKSSGNAAETKSHDFSDEDSTEDTIRKAIAQQMGRV
jgi:hypothetical protein